MDVEEVVIPLAMKNDVRLYNTRQKFIFETSGLGYYVQEWDSIYHERLRYLETVYKN